MSKEELTSLLESYDCIVTFTKKNGEVREMPCTLRPEALPPVKGTKEPNPDTMSVWCTDKNAWRSFLVANVTQVTAKGVKIDS